MHVHLETVLDILFPPTCIECGRDGTWWCETCLEKIEFIRCSVDPEKQPFSSLSVLSSYSQPGIRLLLTSFKYHRALCLRESIRLLVRRYRAMYRDAWPWADLSQLTMTSVPMDEARKRERGMDHAWELAQIIQQELIPWADLSPLLERTKQVQPNAHLGHNALRRANVKGIFQPLCDAPTNVLLVDDVFTTGATLSEAANVLHQAGAVYIHALTLAKGN